MSAAGPRVTPYEPRHRARILALSRQAWGPVFAGMEAAAPEVAYDTFYPSGWGTRQAADIEAFLDAESRHVWVALDADDAVGWVGVRLHPASATGEIHILAVDPLHQRQGLASALIEAAVAFMREAGMTVAMAETGDDPGHAASRATYESNGFERRSVARYIRRL